MHQQLLIVTGKGGVGKSAVTAALAIEAARRGQKVLAISMVDHRGLATHLGADQLAYKAAELRPGIFALGIERPEALDEYLRIQLRVPKLSRIGPVARAFDALASAAPGIRETVTMGKVLFETRSNNWDLVVADAPPSGQIGSHIRAPRTVSELVGAGRVREQTRWMEDLMGDATRTGLVVVTLAEELPTIETTETLEWIAEEQLINVAEVITNRILEPLGVAVPSDTSSPLGAAAALHDGIYNEQQRWLAQISQRGRQLPYLFGTTGPVEVAERLADVLEQR